MKKTNRRVVTTKTETFSFVYEKDVVCKVTIVNDTKLTYSFGSTTKEFGNKKLYYIEDISQYQNTRFSDQYALLNKERVLTTVEELENLDVSKLYYLGMGNDAMIRDRYMNPITSLMVLDDIFIKIWGKVRTLKKSKKLVTKAETLDWVKSAKIVPIPYYNQDDCKDTDTCIIEVLLPQEMYQELFEETKVRYATHDQFRLAVLNRIKAVELPETV
jgi:hypothetical protein